MCPVLRQLLLPPPLEGTGAPHHTRINIYPGKRRSLGTTHWGNYPKQGWPSYLAVPRSWKSSAVVHAPMPGRPGGRCPRWRRHLHWRRCSSWSPWSRVLAGRPGRRGLPSSCPCVWVVAAGAAVAGPSSRTLRCRPPLGHWSTCGSSSCESPRCRNKCDPERGGICGLPVKGGGWRDEVIIKFVSVSLESCVRGRRVHLLGSLDWT